MKFTSDVMKGYRDIEVPYTLISQEEAEGIAIIMPGWGYTVQAPLLHYSTGIYLHKGYDVLHINYQYTTPDYKGFSIEEVDDALKYDVKEVIDQVLQEKNYSRIHLMAKSFGTIALSNELTRESFQYAKLIWLTPLLKEDEVFQAMLGSEKKGICIIGDADRHYEEVRFHELKSNHRLRMHLVKGVNHSLEHDFQVLNSISTHKEIMSIIEAFIKA